MLQSIWQAIQNIGSFFTGIGTFIKDLIQDIVYMISVLTVISGGVLSYFSWLPLVTATIFSTVIAIVIIYKIIGREG